MSYQNIGGDAPPQKTAPAAAAAPAASFDGGFSGACTAAAAAPLTHVNCRALRDLIIPSRCVVIVDHHGVGGSISQFDDLKDSGVAIGFFAAMICLGGFSPAVFFLICEQYNKVRTRYAIDRR